MNLKRADIPADGRPRRRCNSRFDKMKTSIDHGMGWANRTISFKGRKGIIPGLGGLFSTARQKISSTRQRYSKGMADDGQAPDTATPVLDRSRAVERVYVQPLQGASSLTLVGDDNEPKMSCMMSASESTGTLVAPLTGNSNVVEIKSLSAVELKTQCITNCDASTWERSYTSGRQRHLIYYELPEPWRENPYLLYGHRFYDSHKKSILSIFNFYGWHNETLNIWSHIVGCFILIYLLAVSFPSSDVFRSAEVPVLAKSIIILFLICGIKCMVSSVIWHTFSGTCKLAIRSRFSCIDYTGITVLITASIVTMEFILWYRISQTTMYLYMLTTLCSGVMGGWLNWLPKFDGPQSRVFRVALYGLMVLLGLISIAHHAISHLSNSGLYLPVLRKSLIWYFIGVIFYATLIPERWRSDITLPVEKQSECSFHTAKRTVLSLWWVDYCCHSHFIWHIFVVLGVMGFYEAILDMSRLTWLQPLVSLHI